MTDPKGYPIEHRFSWRMNSWKDGREQRGFLTGEFRNPKKGEYYLSGGPAQGWKAPNDLDSPYYILRIATVRKTVVTTYKEVGP